jgi:hypothetical protein
MKYLSAHHFLMKSILFSVLTFYGFASVAGHNLFFESERNSSEIVVSVESDIVRALTNKSIPVNSSEKSGSYIDQNFRKKIVRTLIQEMEQNIASIDAMQLDAASRYPNSESYTEDPSSVVKALGTKLDLAKKLKDLAVEQNDFAAFNTAYDWIHYLTLDSKNLLNSLDRSSLKDEFQK